MICFQLKQQLIRQSQIPQSGNYWTKFNSNYAVYAGHIASLWSAADCQNYADKLKEVLDKVEQHRPFGSYLAEECYVSLVSSKAVLLWLKKFWTLQHAAMEENSPLNKAYATAVARLGLPEPYLLHVPRTVVSKQSLVSHLGLVMSARQRTAQFDNLPSLQLRECSIPLSFSHSQQSTHWGGICQCSSQPASRKSINRFMLVNQLSSLLRPCCSLSLFGSDPIILVSLPHIIQLCWILLYWSPEVYAFSYLVKSQLPSQAQTTQLKDKIV